MIRKVNDEPDKIINAGVRCFEAGVEGDIEKGKDSSVAAARRAARATRRGLWRRARRMDRIFRLLQRMDLLPGPITHDPVQRDLLIRKVDDQLRETYPLKGDHQANQVRPYLLRAMALDKRLEKPELGRAIYHLAQRRGFLSNRKADRKDKDSGTVKTAINELANDINTSGSRTLGEHLSKLDPDAIRIRARWTARGMYQKEFDAMMDAQKKWHPETLTDEKINQLRDALFFQRPLKSQKHLIG